MRKFVSSSLIFVFAIILAPIHTADAQTAGLVSSIIQKMERNRATLSSLRSGIWMEKHNAQIGVDDITQGVMIYVPNRGRNVSVRVDWQQPQRETLAVQDGKYTLCRPRLSQCYVGSANSKNGKVSNVLGFGLNVSGSQLRSNFEQPQLLQFMNLDGRQVAHLRLVPKGNAGYKFAEIWVDNNTGMPVATKVVERNGDWTTVRLVNPQRNAQVNGNEFRLDTNGAKIIKS